MIRPPRLRTRHLLSVLALAAASLALPAAPASADGPHANLYCTITFTTDINPPGTPELRHRDVTSHGLTGTAQCTGTIDGYQVTGTGIYGINVQEFGNCYAGTGEGTATLQIPTTGGVMTVVAQFENAYDIAAGITGFTGEQTGPDEFVAAEGDCVNTPLSRSTSIFTGTIIT
jgi:hypothetical protein